MRKRKKRELNKQVMFKCKKKLRKDRQKGKLGIKINKEMTKVNKIKSNRELLRTTDAKPDSNAMMVKLTPDV